MSALCFIDTETTGLDPRIHQPYEVCWWRENEGGPTTMRLPHTLEYADQQALRIGDYWGRFNQPWVEHPANMATAQILTTALLDVTFIGSNPAFDAAMLTRFIGAPVWHHRMIDVAQAGMWVFGWDRPKGLADTCAELRSRGHEIPEPDHTAEGDVRATRAIYYALRREADHAELEASDTTEAGL